MKCVVFAFVGLCLVSLSAFSDYSAAYIAGIVEHESAGRWRELRIGDTVPEGARIRLADAARELIAEMP